MNTLRDSLWIWGHDAGCHHKGAGLQWKIPGENKMGPAEAAEYLGIPNCCRVVFEGSPATPFDEESRKLSYFRNVVWSITGDVSSVRNSDGNDDLAEVIRQAKMFGNVTGGVLDDFFRPAQKDARMSLERMREVRDTLHSFERPLELWLVYYAALFDIDYSKYLDLVDVLTFWSWTSEELARAEENLERMCVLAHGKKCYAGCYLYNYGDCRELTDDEMKFQLELYLEMWKSAKIDGIIFCSNNIVDTGVNSINILRQWLAEHSAETR